MNVFFMLCGACTLGKTDLFGVTECSDVCATLHALHRDESEG